MDFILYSQEGLWFLRIPLHRYAKFLADEKKQKYAYFYLTQLGLTESINVAFKFACLGQYGHSSEFLPDSCSWHFMTTALIKPITLCTFGTFTRTDLHTK